VVDVNASYASQIVLFPLADYWPFYIGFIAFVLLMLALDLGVFHKNAHEVSTREACAWSAVWVALALSFNFFFYKFALWKLASDPRLTSIPGFNPEAAAQQSALEFLTGYVVEKTLSLDNIFVFVVVFTFFGIPTLYQHRVLFYGIIGALIFRAVFISLGSILLQYHWIILLFGGVLILTGVKMMFAPERPPDPGKNPLIRLFRHFVPVTSELHGQRFYVRLKGVMHATPLLLALLFIEITDVIFAVDSVPAIFAITKEPMIVFTSNVFAILGLRALYFLLANAVERFSLLKYGLAIVLIFVGLKMVWLNDAFGGKFPITWSLGIICGVLATSMAISFAVTKRQTQ